MKTLYFVLILVAVVFICKYIMNMVLEILTPPNTLHTEELNSWWERHICAPYPYDDEM